MVCRCPDCGFVMPLHPNIAMTWCPCGWRADSAETDEPEDEELEAA